MDVILRDGREIKLTLAMAFGANAQVFSAVYEWIRAFWCGRAEFRMARTPEGNQSKD